MLRGKLHLSHPHHWVPMVFNLSRVIHWLREAAQLPARYGTRRASIEETTPTAVFVAAALVWTPRSGPPGGQGWCTRSSGSCRCPGRNPLVGDHDGLST